MSKHEPGVVVGAGVVEPVPPLQALWATIQLIEENSKLKHFVYKVKSILKIS